MAAILSWLHCVKDAAAGNFVTWRNPQQNHYHVDTIW